MPDAPELLGGVGDAKKGTTVDGGCLHVAVGVITACCRSMNWLPLNSNSRGPCAEPQSQRSSSRSSRPALFQSMNFAPSSVTRQLDGREREESQGGAACNTSLVSPHSDAMSLKCGTPSASTPWLMNRCPPA